MKKIHLPRLFLLLTGMMMSAPIAISMRANGMRRPGPLVILLGVLGVLLICAAWWAAESIAQSYESKAYQAGFARARANANVVQQFALRMASFARTVHHMGERWAELQAAGETMAADEAGRAMQDITRDRSNPIDFIGIFSASGQLRWWSGEVRPNTNVQDRDYFRVLQAGSSSTFIGTPVIGRQSGALVIPIASRMQDVSGNFAGVVVALVRVAYVSEILADLVAEAGEFAALLRNDGVLLARSSRTEELAGRSVLSNEQIGAMSVASGSVDVHSKVTGRDQLIAWRRVDGTDLIAVVGIDATQLAAHAARDRVLLRGLAAGFTGVLVFASIAAILSIFIAQQRMAVRAQAVALETLHSMHAGLPAIFFLQDVASDGSLQIRYIDGRLEAVTGWAEKSVRAAEISLFAETPEKARLVLSAVLRDSESRTDWQLRQPDGGWRWMRSTVRLLERRDDGSARIVGYTIDISAEREAQLRAQAAARLSSLGEMAAGLAHELKQPLTAISLAAENAEASLASTDAAGAARRLQRITQQAHRAGQIIDNLRRFARVDISPAPVESVPLSQVLENSIALLSGTLNDAGIVLDVQLAAGDHELAVLADPIGLAQVLVNLLLNARDAIAERPPGAERRISVCAKPRSDDQIDVQVADTGCGIAQEILPRLFQPFVTTKGPDKGTGLGLSVSYGILKNMGGTIEGHNATEGAVFTITLPAIPRPSVVTPDTTVKDRDNLGDQ